MARFKNKNDVYNISNCIPIGRTSDKYFMSMEIFETEVEIESGNSLWPLGVAAPRKQPEAGVKLPTATTMLLSSADAIRSARELSLLHKRSENNNGPLWPVVWDDKGYAHLYTPRPSGKLFFDVPGHPYRLPRAAAIVVLDDFWTTVIHSGTVPGPNERRKVIDVTRVDAVARNTLASAIAEMVDSNGEFTLDDCGGIGSSGMLAVVLAGVTKWLLDTGASHHLVGKQWLTNVKQNMYKVKVPLCLTTANKNISVDDCIDIQVKAIDEDITAYCLPDCPPALAVGRLTIERGYDFWLPAWSHTAVFTRPDGVKVFAAMEDYTPILTESVLAMPARESRDVNEQGEADSQLCESSPALPASDQQDQEFIIVDEGPAPGGEAGGSSSHDDDDEAWLFMDDEPKPPDTSDDWVLDVPDTKGKDVPPPPEPPATVLKSMYAKPQAACHQTRA